jgi:hypothetical protein
MDTIVNSKLNDKGQMTYYENSDGTQITYF